MVVELVGGPLDGKRRSVGHHPPRQVYVVAASEQADSRMTFYKRPKPRAHFYQYEHEVRLPGKNPAAIYLYVGDRLVVCGCGATFPRDQVCLCGARHKARTD